ncbi:uncharacterized protein LOC143145233 isoform X1 [Ptiloglossa arizonensis]|uniref:uncharacterized protein LOC143145233 isoform X1 n=1 Tax=Ptiloglossa arizonensis TaxID=3350558 RepID=UPI003FA03701
MAGWVTQFDRVVSLLVDRRWKKVAMEQPVPFRNAQLATKLLLPRVPRCARKVQQLVILFLLLVLFFSFFFYVERNRVSRGRDVRKIDRGEQIGKVGYRSSGELSPKETPRGSGFSLSMTGGKAPWDTIERWNSVFHSSRLRVLRSLVRWTFVTTARPR